VHWIKWGRKEGRKPNPNWQEERRNSPHSRKFIMLLNILNVIKKNPYLIKKFIFYSKNYGIRIAISKAISYIERLPGKSQRINILEDYNYLFNENNTYNLRISLDKPVDILIPVYNGYEYLVRCLDSIKRNTTIPYRLLICDDASTDERVWQFLERFKRDNKSIEIILLRNEKNQGFVKTVNRLYKYVQNHFVIINTDVEVPKGWLERLIYPIIKNPNLIATVTPFTNACTIFSFPFINQDNELFEGLSVEKIDQYFRLVNEEPIDVPSGAGFCMAFNKDVVDEIGLFDEVYGRGYGEENDFCMRAYKKGYKNVLVPNLFVYHKHGASFGEEKVKLMEKNLNILISRYPEYLRLVDNWIKEDPAKHIRDFVMLKILSDLYGNKVVIDHNLGGGANFYREQLLQETPLATVITNDGFVIFAGYKLIDRIVYRYLDFSKAFTFIVKNFKTDKIIINNLVGYENWVEILHKTLKIKKKFGIKLSYKVHDYYCICPIYTLLDYKKFYYCGIPSDLSYCAECFANNPIKEELIQIQINRNEFISWREIWRNFLKEVDEIYCFSQSSKDIILRVYPYLDEKIIIKPHKVDYIETIDAIKYNKNRNSKIKIAVIGNINVSKGAKIIYEIAKYIDEKKITDIELHLFGELIYKYIHPKIIQHGKYKREQLPKLMLQNDIDIILIPSVWPETFSYTTEEAMKMGLPVAVFDLGAPAERVKLYEKGLILEKTDPEYILEKIRTFILALYRMHS